VDDRLLIHCRTELTGLTIRDVADSVHDVDEHRQSPATGTQAVDRASRLLIQILKSSEPLSVGDLARATGLHQSTVSRLLASLRRHGLIERVGQRGRVRIGPVIAAAARGRRSRSMLAEFAQPVLDDLARDTRETITLGVPVPGGVGHIAQADSPYLLAARSWIGQVAPLHCSAGGKVLLAFGATAVGEEPLKRFTPTTVTDQKQLAKELAHVRSCGFAFTLDELEIGLRAVAVPVTEAWGQVVGALAVSGPSARLPKRRLSQCADILRGASSKLSARLAAVSVSDEGLGMPPSSTM
jgi:IclR family transcriptional regulator, acetate operon repressor